MSWLGKNQESFVPISREIIEATATAQESKLLVNTKMNILIGKVPNEKWNVSIFRQKDKLIQHNIQNIFKSQVARM